MVTQPTLWQSAKARQHEEGRREARAQVGAILNRFQANTTAERARARMQNRRIRVKA